MLFSEVLCSDFTSPLSARQSDLESHRCTIQKSLTSSSYCTWSRSQTLRDGHSIEEHHYSIKAECLSLFKRLHKPLKKSIFTVCVAICWASSAPAINSEASSLEENKLNPCHFLITVFLKRYWKNCLISLTIKKCVFSPSQTHFKNVWPPCSAEEAVFQKIRTDLLNPCWHKLRRRVKKVKHWSALRFGLCWQVGFQVVCYYRNKRAQGGNPHGHWS